MKTLVTITSIFLLLFLFSCKISTKNINNDGKTGFFFRTKSEYLELKDENYQILIPKKSNDKGKFIVKIKSKNGEEKEKEINKEEYSKIQEIFKSSDNLSSESKTEIRKILSINL
ncbi:hypothetical protein PG326_05465 [Riemerella anatipestifer]|nr:hypothetical protein [Riemerella anatipestifer]MDY3357776.1 hypothetical protein [Riemerella anatipestifer]